MQSGDSMMNITPEDIGVYLKPMSGMLELARRPRDVKEKGLPDEVSLLKTSRLISGEAHLVDPAVNTVLHSYRTGTMLGNHVAELYAKASQLSALRERNKTSSLREEEQSVFRSRQHVAGMIAAYVAASYIAWSLRLEGAESGTDIPTIIDGLVYTNPNIAVEGLAYFLAVNMQEGSKSDARARVLAVAAKVMADIELQSENNPDIDPFVSKNYKFNGTEFIISGFTRSTGSAVSVIEFNRMPMEKIVGNHAAKRKARQLAMRLACYNPTEKRNPFTSLGGISNIRLGFGKPGTGKSMLIAAIATMLNDLCQIIGIPFIFHPLPDSIVSTFQGGSAERMEKWMLPFRKGDAIIYGPIDDAENVLEERTRQGVSSGVREVIATFLRNTEGAYAKNYGNWAIDLMTNIPEQLDKAVLSRIVDRFPIDGATKEDDFVDQMFLWWQKYAEMSPDFVNLKAPKGHTFMKSQGIIKNIGETYKGHSKPTIELAEEAYNAALKRFSTDEHGFYGALGVEVQKRFNLFSSRDVRNIQSAVSERISDFDFPSDWETNPDLFFRKAHDEKKNMLVELMKTNMGNLSFGEILLQETSRYLDTLAEISSKDFERKVAAYVESHQIQVAAKERIR
jgi:hypothetical protein